ncbi:MAG: phosphatase PAP2 family protein [Candidatus Kapabacteria bacterium]|nr:phosphatase PAP2 family protein [Ignavibacteriota bacterium]MCW5883698.1 phosphatase PAP2 family protein [Candidatus Kapabacteria bacterium]
MKRLIDSLTMSDIYTLSMLLLYTLLAVIFFNNIGHSLYLIIGNIAIISFVVYISLITKRFSNNEKFMLFRRVYIAPVVFVIYSQIHNYIPIINPELYDLTLIEWDKFLFGVNPTEWIYAIAYPPLTEYLQFSYMLYFVMPIVHGVELHFRKENASLGIFARNILFAFYLSYLLYFFMPAIGPRFFIHDFATLSLELPGLLLTEFFRSIVNNGGGIPIGAVNPADFVNRDCMPSGHTMITLVNVYFVFKNKSKFRIPIFIFSMSLIFATIYLRYHYVVDIIAGVIFAYISIKIEPIIRKFVKEILGFKSA